MTHEPTSLDKFQNRLVRAVRARLTKTGDGLSQSMRVAPALLHIGDSVQVVTRARVAKIDVVPHIKGDVHGDVDYVYVLEAQTMVLVDTEENAMLLAEMERQIDSMSEVDGQASIFDELNGDGDDGADEDG